MELYLYANISILHEIYIIPGCSCKLSCLSSLLRIWRPSSPCYPKAPRLQHIRSLPLLLPRVSSSGLCWKKVFIYVVFICVSGWADSPRAAAAAAWALPWGTLSERGRVAAGRVSQSRSAQRISGDLKRFNILSPVTALPPLIRSLYCI